MRVPCLCNLPAQLEYGQLQGIGNFEAVSRLASDLEQPDSGIEKADVDAAAKEGKRRKRLMLNKIGIPIGSTLLFTRDNSITCTTLDNNRVLYNGEETSLSAAALEILQANHHHARNTANGSIYWMYDGETLDERRQRIEQED